MLMNEMMGMKNAELLCWKMRMMLFAEERQQWNCVEKEKNENE